MPSTPSSPILRHRSIGKRSLRSISAARGAISAVGEGAHRVAQRVDVFAELEVRVRAGPSVSPRYRAVPDIGPAGDRHDGRRHRRDQFALFAVARRLAGPAVDDADRAPRLRDRALEGQLRAARRRQQVDLELDRQHAGVGRHQRERSIAARRIERGRDDAGMLEAVLLGQVGAMRHRQHDPARTDLVDRDAERRHRRLARERIAGAPFVIGVDGRHRMGPSRSGLQLTYTSTRASSQGAPASALRPAGGALRAPARAPRRA